LYFCIPLARTSCIYRWSVSGPDRFISPPPPPKETPDPPENNNCALLGHYAGSSGNFLPTFQDDLSVPFSRVKTLGAQQTRSEASAEGICLTSTPGVRIPHRSARKLVPVTRPFRTNQCFIAMKARGNLGTENFFLALNLTQYGATEQNPS